MKTRFYFSSNSTSASSPKFSSIWDKTSDATRGMLNKEKQLSTAITKSSSENSITTPYKMLTKQFMSDPLKGQAIFGTVKGQLRCMESIGADMCSSIVIKIVAQSIQGWDLGTIQNGSWSDIIWASGLDIFCAISNVAYPKKIAISNNGLVYTAVGPNDEYGNYGIAYSPDLGIFVTVGSYNIKYSTNGTDWSYVDLDDGNSEWFSVAWASGLGIFVAIGIDGDTGDGACLISDDGINWVQHSIPSIYGIYSKIVWVDDLGLFILCEINGQGIKYSSNGQDWTTANIPPGTENNNWTNIAWSPELGLLVVVSGENPGTDICTIITSTNGSIWTKRYICDADNIPLETSMALISCSWSPELGMFLAVSIESTGAYSNDGEIWHVLNISANNIFCACWSPHLGKFSILGLNRACASDGILERGTLLSYFPTTLESEYSQNLLINKFLLNKHVLNLVNCCDGDRLIVEIGATTFNSDTSEHTAYHNFGDEYEFDLPENEIDTGLYNPWIEFTRNILQSEIASGISNDDNAIMMLGDDNNGIFNQNIEQNNIDIPKITTHCDCALNRLLYQYRESVRLKSLILALYGYQCQSLENAIYDLASRLNIDISEGWQLDRIGEIVGQSRQCMVDAMYRIWIKAKIAQNVSNGDIEQIISIWRIFVPSAETVRLVEAFPAGVVIFSDIAPDPVYEALITSFMQQTVCASVEFGWSIIPDPDLAFQFEGALGLGFGDLLNTDMGGELFYIIL